MSQTDVNVDVEVLENENVCVNCCNVMLILQLYQSQPAMINLIQNYYKIESRNQIENTNENLKDSAAAAEVQVVKVRAFSLKYRNRENREREL